MIEVRDLLAKFSNLLVSEEFKKESIRKTIEEVVGVGVDPKDIEIKGGTVYLNIKPIYKNEIFIKKEKIQATLQEKLGRKSPQDIR
jgi:hypothetical protein